MNLGIDAGGTHLRAQIWDNSSLVASYNAKSSEVGLYTWTRSILNDNKNIKNIGIAYAGQVENGCIISAPNIDIDQYEIKKAIESDYKLSLKIENDLTCAVLAEADEHISKNICALYVGTGLGLGVIESAKLLRGAHNMAAEIGHIPYKETDFRCGCGRNNCLELFASGSGIQKWAYHYNLSLNSTLEDLKKSGDNKIIQMFEEALLYGVGTTITLFNPEVLVLGGGIVTSNTYLKDIIVKRLKEYALKQSLKDLKICLSTLDNASLKGALLLKDYDD